MKVGDDYFAPIHHIYTVTAPDCEQEHKHYLFKRRLDAQRFAQNLQRARVGRAPVYEWLDMDDWRWNVDNKSEVSQATLDEAKGLLYTPGPMIVGNREVSDTLRLALLDAVDSRLYKPVIYEANGAMVCPICDHGLKRIGRYHCDDCGQAVTTELEGL